MLLIFFGKTNPFIEIGCEIGSTLPTHSENCFPERIKTVRSVSDIFTVRFVRIPLKVGILFENSKILLIGPDGVKIPS